jgi:hypothetical protein
MARKAKNKNYFTQETEDAIVLYNNTSNPVLRSKIYEEKIHYAFFKLTQNIIHTFKFYHTEVEDLEHLQHEIIVFLLSKIHLFNPNNGAKAYSYFGTIVKRWCILYNDKNYKSKIKKVAIAELEQDDSHSELFRKRDQIDIFNKKALYIYIHEMIPDVKTPKITKIANTLYDIFKKNYLFYLDEGYIEFQSF